MRNPWKKERWTGKWGDARGRGGWTDFTKKQVNYSGTQADGRFYMSIEDFRKGFKYFTITYYRDDAQLSFYEELDYKPRVSYEYEFELKKTQEMFIGGNAYPDRMYPPSKCKTKANKYTMSLHDSSGRALTTAIFSDVKGYGYIRKSPLPAGKYTIKMSGTAGA